MQRASLDLLVHPDTYSPLELTVSEADGATFSIRDGIPRFVSEDVAEDQTVKSFGQKWEKHRYYRSHTEDFYTDWYLQRYQLGDSEGLKKFLSDKKYVLDAGTGAGRDSANFAAHAPADAKVFGVDTSWAALSAFKTQDAAEHVSLIHADVNRLPFPDEFFDFINCDQVIHHTPDPPVTFANLRKKLKTGGEVCCYVYKKKAVIREFVDDYVRERISDMPIEQALELCEGFTKLGKAFADLETTVELEDDIPILGIKKGTFDVQRFLHWNVMKCFWNDDFDFFTNNIINFDWYHPIYCFRYTPEEFRAWFDAGWEVLSWNVQDAGISCRARKT